MKNRIQKHILSLSLVAVMMAGFGCSKMNDRFDGLLTNPNLPSPAAADVNLYLNQALLSFQNFHRNVSDLTGPLVRQETMFGPTYFNAYSANSFDGVWSTAYTSIIKTTNTLIPLAEEKELYVHSGIAKVLKAFTLLTLVDLFGDVPYSEANLGVENLNPNQDAGPAIYEQGLLLLDSAIVTLQKTAKAKPSNDIYYGGSAASWITLAKTLKLRAYVQTRLVDNGKR